MNLPMKYARVVFSQKVESLINHVAILTPHPMTF